MTERLEIRLSPADCRHLRQLAEVAQRTPSEVVRLLVRTTSPAYVSSGINLPDARGEGCGDSSELVHSAA